MIGGFRDEEHGIDEQQHIVTRTTEHYQNHAELEEESFEDPDAQGCMDFIGRLKDALAGRPNDYRRFLDVIEFNRQEDPEGSRPRSQEENLMKSEFIINTINELLYDLPELMNDFIKYYPILLNCGSDGIEEEYSSSSESSEDNGDDDEEGGDADEDDTNHDTTIKEEEIKEEETEDHDEDEKDVTKEMIEMEDIKPEDHRKIVAEPQGKKHKKSKRKKWMKEKLKRKLTLLAEARKTKALRGMLRTIDDDLLLKMKKLLPDEEVRRCFQIFNMFLDKTLSLPEALSGIKTILSPKYSEVYEELDMLFGFNDDGTNDSDTDSDSSEETSRGYMRREVVASGEQLIRDLEMATICTLGVSYRKIRKENEVKCTGMTDLCREVLNDGWTSYPSWSSEDNGNVSSKKSPYEEFLYRTEDERFELDICLDVNKYAIESMEILKRKIDKMPDYERNTYKLDDKLGCSSGALMTRAIRRIYGEAASKIIEGMRENPAVAVPRVLQRCIEKEQEWREAQKTMNRMWREQLEKQMIRSLDHQTSMIKQCDIKLLKTKSIIHQVEQFFDIRQGRKPDEDVGPHISFSFPGRRKIFTDANDLIIHYLKRQQSYSKEDKRRMKIVLRKIVLEWFCLKQEDMSDDENEEELDLDRKRCRRDNEEPLEYDSDGNRINLLNYYADDYTNEWPPEEKYDSKTQEFMAKQKNNEYRLFYGDDTLYLFIRFHQTICDRLNRVHTEYLNMCEDYHAEQRARVSWEKEIEQVAHKSLLNVEKNWGELGQAIKSIRNVKYSPLTYYNLFINDIKRNLDGEMDASAYEDSIRQYFPTLAALFFSIDKILGQTVKLLSTLANNEDDCHAVKMYMRYRLRTPTTTFRTNEFVEGIEREYGATAEHRLHGKNCFKFEYCNSDEPSMNVQLVDTEDSLEDENEQDDNTGSSGHESSCDDRQAVESNANDNEDESPPKKRPKLVEEENEEGQEEEEDDDKQDASVSGSENPEEEEEKKQKNEEEDEEGEEDESEEDEDEEETEDEEEEESETKKEEEEEEDEKMEEGTSAEHEEKPQKEEEEEEEGPTYWSKKKESPYEIMRNEAIRVISAKLEKYKKSLEGMPCSRNRMFTMRPLPRVPFRMFMSRIMKTRILHGYDTFNIEAFGEVGPEDKLEMQGGFHCLRKPKAQVEANRIRTRMKKLDRWKTKWNLQLGEEREEKFETLERNCTKTKIADPFAPLVSKNMYSCNPDEDEYHPPR